MTLTIDRYLGHMILASLKCHAACLRKRAAEQPDVLAHDAKELAEVEREIAALTESMWR